MLCLSAALPHVLCLCACAVLCCYVNQALDDRVVVAIEDDRVVVGEGQIFLRPAVFGMKY